MQQPLDRANCSISTQCVFECLDVFWPVAAAVTETRPSGINVKQLQQGKKPNFIVILTDDQVRGGTQPITSDQTFFSKAAAISLLAVSKSYHLCKTSCCLATDQPWTLCSCVSGLG